MLELTPISILSDNYVWLLSRPESSRAAIVDPGEAVPVLTTLAGRGIGLAAILLTHHHGDHTGGAGELVRRFAAPVHAAARESNRAVDRPDADGDMIALTDLDIELRVLEVPGHTSGHVAYLGDGFVLTGDALFAGGCGRVFEGTPAQMHASLSRLATLPPPTQVYCAHEYTLSNLAFAREVEPGNEVLVRRLEQSRELRSRGEVTLPSTIEVELATNPFLRCNEPAVVAAAERRAGRPVAPGAETFAVIRAWKDVFR